MQKITPFLWFDNQAEEAANYYVSIFKDAKLGDIARYGKGGPAPEGSVMVAPFTIAGQEFLALNGGPMFKFSEAISFVINCKDQEEIDYYWNALTADGGYEGQCGWCKDKFGLSWQIVPEQMGRLASNGGPKSMAVMGVVMGMKKLDIAAMEQAFENAA